MDFLTSFIAQAPTQSPPTGQPQSGSPFFFFAVMLAFLVFMLLSSRSQKKREKREREDMFARMDKNDRVQTVGGIIGTIVSVKDDEVVLKVDESTNTKMTLRKTSVQQILDSAKAGSSDAGKK